jgi:DNA-3-methyladenine glycosylase II
MKPDYWTKACQELSKADPHLKKIIKSYDGEYMTSRGEAFETLMRSIVGQQISVKAAQTVWLRLSDALPQLSPKAVLKASIPKLRKCGLSERKAEYIQDLAKKFIDGTLAVDSWPQMSDDEIVEHLIQVRGIGRWTAEMFLMFHLLRPNVFPVDDIGLQNALMKAYGKRKPLSDRTLSQFRKKFNPWGPVAAWYLWRSLDPIPVEY